MFVESYKLTICDKKNSIREIRLLTREEYLDYFAFCFVTFESD